ncbi:MAG TPA: ribosome silencing factor [Verrucomicrobiae bacterium]|nr:ribosome silencing factor [Verrucomicrobiae bacterium]
MSQARRRRDEGDASLALARRCRDGADEKNARDVVILDMRGLSSVTDYFVVCSGDVQPQLRAIADEIEKRLREGMGRRPRGIDGLRGSNWVVLDYGDVVVHVFQHALRLHYGLEELWSDAPRVL